MLAPGLSGRCWPAHLQPLADESLSSWTLRLAAAHRIKAYTFAQLTWPGRFVWHTRDLDRTATRDLTNEIAERTTCSPTRAWDTTLAALAGIVLPRSYPTHGRLRGVLDVRTFDGVRRRHGQQYCARCWADDPVVYLRRAWRLSVVTVCPRHSVLLSDACPACDAPVLMQRADVGGKAGAPPAVLQPTCPACGADYRVQRESRGRSTVAQTHATDDEVWLAWRLATARAAGAATLGRRAVDAPDWFELARYLARLLATGRAARRLASAIVHLGGPSINGTAEDAPARLLEACRLRPRRTLVHAAGWLLRGWPDRFVASADAAGLWSSDLLRDFDAPPDFFRETVLTYRNARARRGGTRGLARGLGGYARPQRRDAELVDTLGRTMAAYDAASSTIRAAPKG